MSLHPKSLSRFLLLLSLICTSLITPGRPTLSQPVAPAAPLVSQSAPGKVPIEVLAGHATDVYRLAPPAGFKALRPATATFTINYVAAGSTNELGDTCYAWPAGSQAAFTYAANIWGTQLNSTVPIKIEACWAHLGSGILGHSATDSFWRNFTGAPQANTWYPVALANALSGADQNGAAAEIHIAYSDNGISWYFGTDGATPVGQYDFISVVLHEITHGLGFAGSMRVASGVGSWGFTGYAGTPVSYDRFIENGAAQSLLNTGLFPNPSAALAAQLTGNNLYFNGANATAANGGSHPRMYAPGTWASGSSYSHLDYTTFASTINRLMVYAIDDGASIHDPGPVTMGLLKDNGWPDAVNPTPTITSLSPTSALPGGPAFTLTVNGTNFLDSSLVQWNGSSRTTTYVNSAQLTAAISATDILITGTASVTVYNPNDDSTSNALNFIVGALRKVYLPVISMRWPPVPDVPTLNAINNPANANAYSVTWNPAVGAASYTLQEDDNAGFSSPTSVYSGAGTSLAVSGKPAGTYYYRVKATNAYGDSAWSVTRSTTVAGAATGISGRITYQGNPLAGISVELRFYNGSAYSSAGTTSTAADGTYKFLGAASLGTGQSYYVRYLNSANANYLAYGGSPDVTSYAAGSSVPLGNMDIANISLVAPAPGATVALPRTFQWSVRTATTSDNYEFNLFPDVSGSEAFYPTVGYVGSYNLTGLPSGFSTGKVYDWFVGVYGNTGTGSSYYGQSYYYRTVTFSSGLKAQLGIERPLSGKDFNQIELRRLHSTDATR